MDQGIKFVREKRATVLAGIFLAVAACFGWPSGAAAAQLSGFLETAFGARLTRDGLTKHDSYNMLEERAQLKLRHAFAGEDIWADWRTVFSFKGDLVLDGYYDTTFDPQVRDLNLALSPASFLDIKMGRQVLTWGTGDYLFINDLFPKDYVSFYLGREDEYLKMPSDALRLSFFPKAVNVDLVLIGVFEPNEIPKGDQLSFFDSFQGGIAGRESDRSLLAPARQAENAVYAARAYRNFGSSEAALYLYRGFDPMPRSYESEADRGLYYQRLDAYGGSLRGPLAGGIANAEIGYYHSPEDSDGSDRLVQNSMFKGLVGYEKDLGNDLKIGLQYQYDQTLDYGAYTRALLPGDYIWDQYRHLLTQRVTKFFKNQTVLVTIFNFYSPSNQDGYLRSSVAYDITDRWKVTCGVNIPWGADYYTDFGQMKRNKNIFVRVRSSF